VKIGTEKDNGQTTWFGHRFEKTHGNRKRMCCSAVVTLTESGDRASFTTLWDETKLG